jgi:hypothetical protein
VHENSYVIVADARETGYGGIIQGERYVFGKPAPIAHQLRPAG